jgi:esterase/lipase superfamily enzyme
VQENFGFDETYYSQNSPWIIVKKQVNKIKDKTKVRLLVGDEDKLLPLVTNYHRLLDSLKIEHQFKVIAGARHQYNQIISKATFNTFSFWKDAFKK